MRLPPEPQGGTVVTRDLKIDRANKAIPFIFIGLLITLILAITTVSVGQLMGADLDVLGPLVMLGIMVVAAGLAGILIWIAVGE